MSPQTGAVYAMSSYPELQPVRCGWAGISTAEYAALSDPANNEPLLNRAIDGQYIPGSTFKLNTATAALNTGLITPELLLRRQRHLQDPGLPVQQHHLHLPRQRRGPARRPTTCPRPSPCRATTSSTTWATSSTPSAASTARPPSRTQAAQYSLGQLTGIDLPGEVQGRVDSQAERVKLHAEAPTAFPNTTWYTGDNIEMAFGQGGTYITPIEQAVAYSTFANGGTRYAPQVAAAVVSPTGKVVSEVRPPGRRPRDPARRQPTRPCSPGSKAWSTTGAAPPTGVPRPGQLPRRAGRQDRDRRHRAGQGAHRLVRGLRADGRPPVRGGLRHRPGRLRGHGGGPGGPGQIFSYLAAHPVGPAVIPPSSEGLPGHPGIGLPDPTDHHHAPRPPGPARPPRRPSARERPPAAGDRPGHPGPTPGPRRPRMAGEMESLWPRVEPLLAQVTKPARYIGGELGAQVPSTADGAVSWLLIYPDTYEIGLPNQGLQILYEILNERPDAAAERAYAPWVDMEAAMRSAGVPLFSLENHLPARAFDVLAFNLSAELVYTNVLNLIDLAGVPVRGRRTGRRRPARGGRRPLRLQPRAAGRLRRLLRAGGRRGGGRRDQRGRGRLEGRRRGPTGGRRPRGPRCSGRCPGWPGVYVPACYEAHYHRRGLRRPTGPCPGWRPPPPASPRPPTGSRSGPSPTWASGPTRDSSWCRSSRWSTTASTSSCSGAAPGAAGSARRG